MEPWMNLMSLLSVNNSYISVYPTRLREDKAEDICVTCTVNYAALLR